jgi:hypothetical protein
MNCLLRCVGLTVAGGGINILQQKLRRRARRRPKPSSSTYSSVRPIAGCDVHADLRKKRGNPRRLPVYGGLAVYRVTDTIALLGRTPAALRRACQ